MSFETEGVVRFYVGVKLDVRDIQRLPPAVANALFAGIAQVVNAANSPAQPAKE